MSEPTTEPTIERDIRELISFAIMDGQNQIHDLKDGTATPEEINERMFKSLDYFTDKATKLISDQVAKARIEELEEVIKRNNYGMTKSQLGTLDRIKEIKRSKE